MKAINIIKSLSLSASILVSGLGHAAAQSSEPFRTDINPALLYYRAFLVTPNPQLGTKDFDYLFSNAGRSKKLPEKLATLFHGYDEQFKLLRQAANATVPCDWGIDWSAGPDTWLPQLARAKAVAQAANFRVRWELEHGQQSEAVVDFLGALALGRNLPRDGFLISTLVQIAIEAIDCNRIAESFGLFSPQALQQLVKGLDAAPNRGTVADCIPTEKGMFRDWLLRKINELRKRYPGDDAKVMAGLREVAPGAFEKPRGGESSVWESLMKAAGGTSDGLIRMLHERDRVYDRLAKVLALPYSEFQRKMQQLVSSVRGDPMVSSSVAAFSRARAREFRVEAWLAMVRAAVAYKLHGQEGLKSVQDPCGNGPFAFSRFVFDGVDRGFELRSVFNMDGAKAALIFVETPGPAFRVDGPHIGQPVP